jgi:hypothetical protein
VGGGRRWGATRGWGWHQQRNRAGTGCSTHKTLGQYECVRLPFGAFWLNSDSSQCVCNGQWFQWLRATTSRGSLGTIHSISRGGYSTPSPFLQHPFIPSGWARPFPPYSPSFHIFHAPVVLWLSFTRSEASLRPFGPHRPIRVREQTEPERYAAICAAGRCPLALICSESVQVRARLPSGNSSTRLRGEWLTRWLPESVVVCRVIF